MRWLCVAAWMALTPLHLEAEVFWRHPADIPGNWARAYQTDVRLQNGSGELAIYISGDRLSGVEAYLRGLHGDHLSWYSGDVMAWGMAIEDGLLYRYLVQPRPEPQGGFWITALTQPVREAGRPADSPRTHQLNDLPTLPQSTPTFYSKDEGNQTEVEISETVANPASALDQLSTRIVEEGWQPSPANLGGFRMFVRRDRVAFVGAHRGKDGRTRVLRLHKPLGVR